MVLKVKSALTYWSKPMLGLNQVWFEVRISFALSSPSFCVGTHDTEQSGGLRQPATTENIHMKIFLPANKNISVTGQQTVVLTIMSVMYTKKYCMLCQSKLSPKIFTTIKTFTNPQPQDYWIVQKYLSRFYSSHLNELLLSGCKYVTRLYVKLFYLVNSLTMGLIMDKPL